MKTPFYKLIQKDIMEKFKLSNIVMWYDYKKEFIDEFNLFDEENINKIAYEGSFIELRHKILLEDSRLTKKWLIYSDKENTEGFLTEYEFFGEIYKASVKDVLESEYKIDFGQFNIATLEDRLSVLKTLWDMLPENTIKYLDQETLDDIILTNGFGYVDINKEYTVLKYICETEKYDLVLEEFKIKDKFFESLLNEYGIDVTGFTSSMEIVKHIVTNLFQSELIQKSRDKNIRPFDVRLSNSSKRMNCVQLLETWANYEIYKEYFVEHSKKISKKYMVDILKSVELEDLLSLEYIYGIEEILYKKLEIEVIQGEKDLNHIKENLIAHVEGISSNEDKTQDIYSKEGNHISGLKENLKELKLFVDIRRRYYFSRANIFNNWNILNNIFQILDLLYDFEDNFNINNISMDDLVDLYETENWWKIDQLYRKVQEDESLMDDFITRLLRVANSKYHYNYLKSLNEEVSNALDSKDDYNFRTDSQLEFWSKHVSSSEERTAVLIVDALRYEMGKEILSMIDEVENKTLTPLISAIPSVTEFGMASLLPNGNRKLKVKIEEDSIKILDGNFNTPINTKKERIEYFLEQADNTAIIKDLNDITNASTNNLKNEFKGKSRIVVFSNEIDEAGHIENSNIQMFPTLLKKIQVSINKLIETGLERIVVVADHGFILTSGLEEWMRIELPKDMDNLVKKRRYSISRNKVEGNYITKTCYSANHDGELYFNFPRGINIFTAGGGTKFYHGGTSIQELVVPVITIKQPTKEQTKITSKYIEQVDFKQLGVDKLQNKKIEKEIPETIKEQIQTYLKNENLNKREKRVLELFTVAHSYTDSEIQDICGKDGVRFISQSVMAFMDKLIEVLSEQGHDWIGFRVIGISTYEYFLK